MEGNTGILHLIARNTILNFAGQLIPLVIAVFSLPFIIKQLGTDSFGLLSLALATIGYFIFFDFGLGRATTKFVAEFKNKNQDSDAANIIWLSIGLHLLLGIVSGLLLVWISPLLIHRFLNIPPDLIDVARQVFVFLALTVPCVILAGVLRASLAAVQRFDLINAVKIPTTSLNYLIPVIILLLGQGLHEIFLYILITRIFSTIIYFVLCLRIFPALKTKAHITFPQLQKLLLFGGWVAVSNFLGPVFTYLDRFLIGAILTLSAVSYYTAPYDTVTRVWILPVSLTLTLYPAFSAYQTDDQKEYPNTLFLYSVKYLSIIMVPLMVTIIFFAPEILKIWLGQDFAVNSSTVLQVLALGVLFNSTARIPYSLLQGIGRPDLPAKFHLLQLPLYLGLMWFFIKHFGIAGAALAWTLRILLDTALLFWASHHLLKPPKELIKQTKMYRLMVLFALYSGSFLIGYKLTNAFFEKALIAIGLHVLFVGVCWTVFMDSEEKVRMKNTIKAIGYRPYTTK